MKKTFTLIIALCSFIMVTQGQVLYEEQFNYSVANLAQEPTWTSLGTPPGIGTGRNIVTPPLSYITTDGTYVLSDMGKAIKSDYLSGATDYYSFKQFTTTPITSTVYLSFLYQAGVSQKQSQSEVFGLGDSASTGPKIWAGKGTVTATNYRLGVTRVSGTGAEIKWAATEFSDTLATILVVLKYDFSTSTASLFINPTLATITEPTADAFENTYGTTIRTKLSALRFRYNGNNRAYFTISGARVSGSWADAVAKVSTVGNIDQMDGKDSFKIYMKSNMMNMEYRLTGNTRVNLVLYNISGQAIKTVINNSNQSAGNYLKYVDVSDLKSGVYIARLTSGNATKSFKVVINR